MSEAILIAIIAAGPGLLAALVAWDGRTKAKAADRRAEEAAKFTIESDKRLQKLEITMDGYMVQILAAVAGQGVAEGRLLEQTESAHRAAEVAVATAAVEAARSTLAETAAEARHPEEVAPEKDADEEGGILGWSKP